MSDTELARTPTVSICLFVIGAILLLVCAIEAINVALSICCKADSPSTGDYVATLESAAAGILLIGAGVVIQKICQIEFHLRSSKTPHA